MESNPEDSSTQSPPSRRRKIPPPPTDDSDTSDSGVANQLVIYTPEASDRDGPTRGSASSRRGVPSIGAFTVQCAACYKWRLLPSKEKYEEIREHILEEPFVCERAREWRPEVSCDDHEDISQDGSRLWAIDKPSIAQPPPGWERIIRIRGEGGSKFADVYYATPTGKRLRSMVEIDRYLAEHPEYLKQGVSLSRFSFQSPRPLQQNYVRKKATPLQLTSCDRDAARALELKDEPKDVKPISCVAPKGRWPMEDGEGAELSSADGGRIEEEEQMSVSAKTVLPAVGPSDG